MRDLFYVLADVKLILIIGAILGVWKLFYPYRRR